MTEQSATYTTCSSPCANCAYCDAGERCACEQSPYYRYFTSYLRQACDKRELPKWGGLAEPKEVIHAE